MRSRRLFVALYANITLFAHYITLSIKSEVHNVPRRCQTMTEPQVTFTKKIGRDWTHRRKLLLGPGAQAPHFYDHGARLYDEPPPTLVT